MNARKQGYFSEQSKSGWTKLREVDRALRTVRKRRAALLEETNRQICKVVSEDETITRENIESVETAAADLRFALNIYDDLTRPEFINQLNLLQMLKAYELLQNGIAEFAEWALEIRKICSLKEGVDQTK